MRAETEIKQWAFLSGSVRASALAVSIREMRAVVERTAGLVGLALLARCRGRTVLIILVWALISFQRWLILGDILKFVVKELGEPSYLYLRCI